MNTRDWMAAIILGWVYGFFTLILLAGPAKAAIFYSVITVAAMLFHASRRRQSHPDRVGHR